MPVLSSTQSFSVLDDIDPATQKRWLKMLAKLIPSRQKARNKTMGKPTVVKPISPKEVVAKKLEGIPDEVLEAFNEVIAKNFDGESSRFTQDEVMKAITKRMKVRRDKIYANNWLDVEEIYEKNGWRVEFDKPGYNETYDAIFEFTPKRNRRS